MIGALLMLVAILGALTIWNTIALLALAKLLRVQMTSSAEFMRRTGDWSNWVGNRVARIEEKFKIKNVPPRPS